MITWKSRPLLLLSLALLQRVLVLAMPLHAAPSHATRGYIDVCTGDYVEPRIDLVVNCPEPIELRRVFVSAASSKASYGEWRLWNEYLRYCWPHSQPNDGTLQLVDSYGCVVPFWIKKDGKAACAWCMQFQTLVDGKVSGGARYRNCCLEREDECWKLTAGSGEVRTYRMAKADDSREVGQSQPKNAPIRFHSGMWHSIHLLKEIQRPNGNRLIYDHDDKERLTRIEAVSSGGTLLGWLNLEWEPDPLGFKARVTTSDQQWLEYTVSEDCSVLHGVTYPGGLREEYTYQDNGRLAACRYSSGHGYRLCYVANGPPKSSNAPPDSERVVQRRLNAHRVRQVVRTIDNGGNELWGPYFHYRSKAVGTDSHRLTETSICGAAGAEQELCLDCYDELTSISYFGPRPKPNYLRRSLLLKKLNGWSRPFSPRASIGRCEQFVDGNDQELVCRFFGYDGHFNVVEEVIRGDFTGSGESELCTKERFFDDFDRIIEESDGFSKVIITYLPGASDLVAARFTYSLVPHEQLVKREFFRYNDWAQLIEAVVDDGTGESVDDFSDVTHRRITRIERRREAPALGLPEQINELFWDPDSGKERLLAKSGYTYDDRCLPIREHVYDAQGVHRYTLEREYDEARRLVRETDALGHVYTHVYDDFGNRIESHGPDGLYTTAYQYDFCHRLIAAHARDQEGNVVTRRSCYDKADRKVASIDECGNETRYLYDSLGHWIEISLPSVRTPEAESLHPTIRRSCDPLGNVIQETLPNGETTRRSYTAHGLVSSVVHPDGAEEQMRYNLAGHLIRHVSRDGQVTEYERDGLGRALVKRLISSDGTLQSETRATYQGLQTASITSEDGRTTYFSYDGAGRLTEERCEGQRTTYSYDALGRKMREVEWLEGGCCISIFEYDLCSRLVEERLEDGLGCVQKRFAYAYDAIGRCVEETVFDGDGHRQSKRTEYDLLGRPIRVVDPVGNQLLISYDTVTNELGQLVKCQRVTDSLGRTTIIISDALGRAVSRELQDSCGQRLDFQTFAYDIAGNQIQHRHEIHRPDGEGRTVIHRRTYGPMGRLVLLEEAVGDPRYRCTRYEYDALGRLLTITKPSGRTLIREYDAAGRLSRHYSKTFDYRFAYDESDRLVAVTRGDGARLTRSYDALGQIVEETLPTGLSVSYERDSLGRCTQVHLPDGSHIAYTYDGAFMSSVSRLDAQGSERYSHCYPSRTFSGQLLEEELPFKLGEVSHGRDALGRQRSIVSSYHGCSIPEGGRDALGNVLNLEIRDGESSYACAYSYDELNQLKAESGVEEHTYVIDSRGDRVWQDGRSFCTDAVGCQPEMGEQLQFDADGRLIERCLRGRVTRYTYDDLDRLVEVARAGQRLVFAYDAFHRRISKKRYLQKDEAWVLELDQSFLYLEGEEVGAVDERGTITELKVPGEGPEAVAIELDATVYIPLHDLRGDLLCLLSEEGEVVENYRYTAFGREVYGSNVGNPWRFGGGRVDDETGFVIFGRRYYWAGRGFGRWITPDPLGYSVGPNLYSYCANNPHAYRDLSGLSFSALEPSGGAGMFGDSRPQIRVPSDTRVTQKKPRRPSIRIDIQVHGSDFKSSRGGKRRPYDVFKDDHVVVTKPSSLDGLITHVTHGDFERPFAEKSEIVHFPEVSNAVVGIGFCNGINTDREYFLGHLERLSKMAGGAQVWGVHNASHGFGNDLDESFLNLVGVKTTPVDLVVKMWEEFFEMADPDAIFLMICHSQGAIISKNGLKKMPESLRQRIVVVAIAPAAYIDDEYCKKVVHFVSTRDFVHWIDFWGAWRCRDTRRILQAHPDANIWDHDFRSPTWDLPLRPLIRLQSQGRILEYEASWSD